MATVVAAGLLAASTAQALPTFTDGSFAVSIATSTTTDVTTTTSFVVAPSLSVSPFGVGSFALVVLPATLAVTSPLDFANVTNGNFDWTDAGLGSFVAASAVLTDSGGGTNAFAKWNVTGTYTVGADFANAGDVLTANETWSLTQTGGPGEAISMSGTFHSPSFGTPEPGTLLLLGAGLLGLFAIRGRRKTAA